jgi:hypothetical protein
VTGDVPDPAVRDLSVLDAAARRAAELARSLAPVTERRRSLAPELVELLRENSGLPVSLRRAGHHARADPAHGRDGGHR